MNQNGSYCFEHPQSAGDLASEAERNTVHEMDAREQMVAARREQQRQHILRSMGR